MSDDIHNVAIYTRVSTEDQAKEGFSLDSQLDRLRNYCKAREWNITGEYIDGGYSGRNTRRPKYQAMMADIDKWDALVIIKMDRIHRNTANFTAMMVALRKKDKQFVSMNESYDTSNAMGRFLMDFVQRMAQLESEITGERVFIGMQQKAKDPEAGYIGGRVPFGYRMDMKDPENHKIIKVPGELEIVKEAFQLYSDGFSFRKVGKKLGKGDTTIRYYLNNVFYVGFERWTHIFKAVNYVDPLISLDLWNKCQIAMRSRCKTHSYDPIIIKDQKKSFRLDKKKVKAIPIINRAKHNISY